MDAPARELLTIVRKGEEVPGVTAYGLISHDSWIGKDSPIESWPVGTDVKESRLHGVMWEVIIWDIALAEWPRGAEWEQAVYDTLAQLVAGGCVVAWLGLEGYFCDPPDLFSPECMSGGVLAAMTSSGDFYCVVDPDEPLQRLDDEILLRLRRHAKGLADGC